LVLHALATYSTFDMWCPNIEAGLIEGLFNPTWHTWSYALASMVHVNLQRAYFTIFGVVRFTGKGLINIEKYVNRLVVHKVDTPDRTIVEALPITTLSHDSIEGNILRTAYVDGVSFYEEPALNPVSAYHQKVRWVHGEITNALADNGGWATVIWFGRFLRFAIFGSRPGEPVFVRVNPRLLCTSAVSNYIHQRHFIVFIHLIPCVAVILLVHLFVGFKCALYGFFCFGTIFVIPFSLSAVAFLTTQFNKAKGSDCSCETAIKNLGNLLTQCLLAVIQVCISIFTFGPDLVLGVRRVVEVTYAVIQGEEGWRPQSSVDRVMNPPSPLMILHVSREIICLVVFVLVNAATLDSGYAFPGMPLPIFGFHTHGLCKILVLPFICFPMTCLVLGRAITDDVKAESFLWKEVVARVQQPELKCINYALRDMPKGKHIFSDLTKLKRAYANYGSAAV